MNFMIENCLQQTGKKDDGTEEAYWTFWVRLFTDDGRFSTTSGFRYYPERNTLALPARLKDGAKNRWYGTTKIDTETYNAIRNECCFKFNRALYEELKGVVA